MCGYFKLQLLHLRVALEHPANFWIASVAIYGLGTSAGTLSALPGGVGANEDVSTLVLTHMGVAAGTAAAAMLLFRATTVLMRIAIGWLVLLVASPRLKIQMSPGGLISAIQGAEQQTHASSLSESSAPRSERGTS